MVVPFHGNTQPIARSAATSIPQGFVQVHGPNGEPLPFAMNPQTGESIPIQQAQLSPEHQELNNRLNDIVTSVYLGMDHFEAMERAAYYGIDRMYGRGFFGRVLAAIERFKTKHGHLRPVMRQTYQGAIASQAAISSSYQRTEVTRQEGQVQAAAASNAAVVDTITRDSDRQNRKLDLDLEYLHTTRLRDDEHRRDIEKFTLEWQAKLQALFVATFGSSPEVIAEKFVEAQFQYQKVIDSRLSGVSGADMKAIREEFKRISEGHREKLMTPETNKIIDRLLLNAFKDDERAV